MGNVSIPLSKLLPHKDQDKNANVNVATTDVAIVPPGTRGTILAVVNGATTTNVTVAARPGSNAAALVFQINNGKTRFIYITDTSFYQQSDGNLHVTTDQAVSMYAITIAHR
jgi:hypothetical protein